MTVQGPDGDTARRRTAARIMDAAGETDASGAAAALVALCDQTVTQGLWSGGVVALGDLAGACFARAFGWMDRERTVAMPGSGIFDLASVTKAVGTSTGLALCIDRGLLDPDARFTEYLPNYRGALPGPVTVRDLARHISGFSNRKPYDVADRVLELILDYGPERPAGEPYEYSCANYILLGMIVERLLEGSLDAVLHDLVFEPLGLRDTRWAPLPNPDPSRVVRQGQVGTFGVASDPPARHANHPVGNAGLFSTADDLGVFCRMMLRRGVHGGRRILSERAVDLLGTRPDDRSPVAFGWRVDAAYNPPSFSERTLSHSGWAGNGLWIDPDTQRYAVVLTNRLADHDEARNVRAQMADIALRAAFGGG